MTEPIRLALGEHAADALNAAEALQTLMEEDQAKFVVSTAALRHEFDRPEFQPLMEVLARSTVVEDQLCDPDLIDKDHGVDLIRRIAAIAPGMEAKLVKLLPARGSDATDRAAIRRAERILELLEATDGSSRLSPMLAHLISHPNARLRAKVVMLMARWTPNLRGAENRLAENNPRVRANAVESLWGDKTSRTVPLLWRAVTDANNRVVGNALFGLYELHDQNAVPKILGMAIHPHALFRATAAWVMGKTRDPQFLPALEKLSHDLYASVRKSALRGIEEMMSSLSGAAKS